MTIRNWAPAILFLVFGVAGTASAATEAKAAPGAPPPELREMPAVPDFEDRMIAPRPVPPPDRKPKPPPKVKTDPDEIREQFDDLRGDIGKGKVRILLKDGSKINGRLADKEMKVKTSQGEMSVSVGELEWIKFGTAAEPALKDRVQALIKQLGDESFEKRESATEQLKKLGALALTEIETARQSTDPEVKSRADQIYEEIKASMDGEPPPREEDEIATVKSILIGSLVGDRIKIETDHGALTLEKSGIEKILGPLNLGDGMKVDVAAENVVGANSFAMASVKVKKGWRVRIQAAGKIEMPGLKESCGPKGLADKQGTFDSDRIQGVAKGCLVGKIGYSRKLFKIGESADFEAESDGDLYLSIALPKDVEATGSFEATVHVSRK